MGFRGLGFGGLGALGVENHFFGCRLWDLGPVGTQPPNPLNPERFGA